MLLGLHRVKVHKVKLRHLRRSVTTVTDVSVVSGRIDAVNLSVEEVVTKNLSKLEKVREIEAGMPDGGMPDDH